MEQHTRLLYALEEIRNENTIDGKIAKIIYELIKNNKEITLKNISLDAFVSNATINRFCKRIKLNGFKELKTLASLEMKHNESTKKLESVINLDSMMEIAKDLIYKTWSENIETAKNLNIIINPGARIQILSTPNYFSEIFGFSEQLKMKGYYSHFFQNNSEWKSSTKIHADFIICISFSGDRKEMIEIIENRENINKDAKYILISSINPLDIQKNIFYFKVLGKTKKYDIPELYTKQSLFACFNMLSLVFTQNSKKNNIK